MGEQVKKKIRVLALFDYCCSTGFATVSSNIMRELYKTDNFDVDVIGINATGDPYDPARFPGRVYPAVTIETMSKGGVDPYGRDKFLTKLAEGVYDVVFTIQDTFIIQTIVPKMQEIIDSLAHKPKTVLYYPIDATPKEDWIKEVVAWFDYPVPYTNYAKAETLAVMPELKDKLQAPIYHGTNTEEFFPVEDVKQVKKFRHEWFDKGLADDRFILLNINRNQPRKDILRSFQVLRCLKDLGDTDTLLYLHMQHTDAGGNLIDQAAQLGLEIGVDYVMPHPRIFNANKGVDVPTLNMIYNASDAVISTTHGEGWGLSITEGFATKTPVICPDNTSMTEMGAENRAKLVPSGDKPESWVVRTDDNDRMRPIVNVEKFAKAVLEVKSKKSLPDLDNAYDFAHKYSWKEVCKQWVALLTQAGQQAQSETRSRLLKAESHQNRKQKSKQKRKKERQNRKAGRR